jgi:hypothetical protein
MENEHMTNASRFIVSRDVPLPFSLTELSFDDKAAMEAQSSHWDYSRMDEGRSARHRDHGGYNCWDVSNFVEVLFNLMIVLKIPKISSNN